jgi:hypothetical protein
MLVIGEGRAFGGSLGLGEVMGWGPQDGTGGLVRGSSKLTHFLGLAT